jgi:hypothetical protein
MIKDHLSIQPIIAEPVQVSAPSRRDHQGLIEYPAQRLGGRSGQRIKIQDHHVTMILIYRRPRVSRPA